MDKRRKRHVWEAVAWIMVNTVALTYNAVEGARWWTFLLWGSFLAYQLLTLGRLLNDRT